MALVQALILALSVPSSRASPLSVSPSRIAARADPPAPSTYPLDGGACGNEWQYLNFDPTSDTDQAHLLTLHNVICSGEMRAISSWGATSAQDVNVPYKRYFPENDPDDADDVTEENVYDVLIKIAGESSTDGMIGEVVGGFVIDNLDFNGDCASDSDTLAYTDTDTLDSREKIHFCSPSWTRPNIADLQCANFAAYASTAMDAFSRIALHEMTHYAVIGEAGPGQIGDAKNDDGDYAYEPERVHALVEENPGLCEINADSYAWMSLETWLSQYCSSEADPPTGRDDTDYFTEDPPAYEPGTPGDSDGDSD
ncbi:hypothetical protein DOTSEDRAFT_72430 [Dothistroma septosporum NZE10]|uniref:Uncharacterized protein n=1 Tax=Dothistroma septosporum (strain NZE10 / CBS 128990) TaxID=675120 RepID=M2YM97_DOTSN|nr:hypothetical protein DOTSEDRAFT_72430 [Dothistroma septosporum NZE10]